MPYKSCTALHTTAPAIFGFSLCLTIFTALQIHTGDQVRKDLTVNKMEELATVLKPCNPDDPMIGAIIVFSTYSIFAKRSLVLFQVSIVALHDSIPLELYT